MDVRCWELKTCIWIGWPSVPENTARDSQVLLRVAGAPGRPVLAGTGCEGMQRIKGGREKQNCAGGLPQEAIKTTRGSDCACSVIFCAPYTRQEKL